MVLGTVLAISDLLLTDQPVDTDSADELTRELSSVDLPDAKLALPLGEAWLAHFAASMIPERTGPDIKPEPIAKWIADALGPFEAVADYADRTLAHFGIEVIRPKNKSAPQEWWIAARNPNLARLQAGTRWRADEEGLGGWSAAAQQLPGAKGSSDRLAGPTQWGTRLPLSLIMGATDTPKPQRQGALNIAGDPGRAPYPAENEQ